MQQQCCVVRMENYFIENILFGKDADKLKRSNRLDTCSREKKLTLTKISNEYYKKEFAFMICHM